MRNRKTFYIVSALALVAAALSVFFGPVKNPDAEILFRIRLPRILMGAIAGAGLAGSGAVMQAVLRNPLADPYIMGTSSGAAFGIVLASLVSAGYASPLYYLLAVSGGFMATLASYFIARTGRSSGTVNLLLSGVIVSAFLSAAVFLFCSFNRQEAFSVISFMLGSVNEGYFELRLFAAAMLIAGAVVGAFSARQLDILALGEEKAQSLGVSVEKIKIAAFVSCSLMTGAAVCVSGTVGFVGIIIPHAVRMIAGPSNRLLLFTSIAGGAMFMIAADAAARTAFAPTEIPVGIITALCGAPFFLWLLKRGGSRNGF